MIIWLVCLMISGGIHNLSQSSVIKTGNRLFCKNNRLYENLENSKHQKPNPKQISMTQIQNSTRLSRSALSLRPKGSSQVKQRIRLQLCPMASSPVGQGLQNDAIQIRWMFRSLDIEIWDLFVIWCLRFGILLPYKASWNNWHNIYFDATLQSGYRNSAY